MEYTELDKATQLALTNQRITNLENQHLQLNLKIEAPAPGEIISQQDRENLAELESSLATLRKLADSLASE